MIIKDDDSQSIDIKYGSAEYKCEDNNWMLSNIKCRKNTSNFDYVLEQNSCVKKDSGNCKSGEIRNKNVKYGTASMLCKNSKWTINKITCLRDTNQFKYTAQGDKCERRDIGNCKNGSSKDVDIKYGTAEYRCSNFKWVIDKVTCDKDTNQYDYSQKGDSCERKDISECKAGRRKEQ